MELVKFSHSVGCCFVLLMVSFATQELFSLTRSHLLIVVLSACTIGALCKNLPPVSMYSRISPTFSSVRFSLSGFMLRSLIYLDLSFVQGDKYESIWILLHADIQFDQYHLLKMLSFF